MISQEFASGVVSRAVSSSVHALVLAANTAQKFSVPENAGYVVISSESGGVFVKFGAAGMANPAVPSASGVTEVCVDPYCIDLAGVLEIGAISKTAQVVTFEFYKNP